MVVETIVKKWGNSFGVLLPMDFVNTSGISEGDKIFVSVIRKGELKPIFGSLKLKKSSQELKDLERSNW